MNFLKVFTRKIKIQQRFFSCSSSLRSNNITKIIDPYSSLSIKSNSNISIKPYDLLDCPESNKLRISLLPNIKNNPKKKLIDISKQVKVNIQDNNIEIENDDEKNRNICLLEVPIKADLKIDCEKDIEISDVYSECVKAFTKSGIINTKNLRSTSIDLSALKGNINCNGLILAKKIDVHIKNEGNIFMDKLQGDLLQCRTFNGDIKVNCCYVEKSNFCCEIGNLNLRNIHKHTEVFVLKHGNISMYGIHGNIYVNSKGGDLNLQFSEIEDDNIIMANKSKNVLINISDLVESSSFIEIHSDKIELEPSANHFSKCLQTEKHFEFGDKNRKNKLMICSGGLLKLGKMSWEDSVKAQMGLS